MRRAGPHTRVRTDRRSGRRHEYVHRRARRDPRLRAWPRANETGPGARGQGISGYPSKKNRAWLRERGIKSTIPERADQIANRRKRPGRPIDFGDEQKERYKGRNVVERCFSFIKQWRGLASRYDKTACSYAAGLCLSAALQWI